MTTEKKITNVGNDKPSIKKESQPFVPTAESKGKATRLRLIAGILWFLAIGAQVVAISMLFKPPVT